MPAFDQCHEQVVRALQKEGWNVEAEQVTLSLGKRRIFVDLRAVRGVNGNRQQIMLIEVKCFPSSTTVNEELTVSCNWTVSCLPCYAYRTSARNPIVLIDS
jgi:hypothetical protein